MGSFRVVVMVVLSFIILSEVAQAEINDVSFRYGRGFDGKDFDQFDLVVSMSLPWEKPLDNGWLMHSTIEGILGVLTWDGDTAVKPSVMPNLVFTSPGGKLDLVGGLGMGVMIGDTEFNDDHNLGGEFFLQGQLGLRWYFVENFFAGYRYYHQSNAGIYSSNNSVNLNQVEVGWKF